MVNWFFTWIGIRTGQEGSTPYINVYDTANNFDRVKEQTPWQ